MTHRDDVQNGDAVLKDIPMRACMRSHFCETLQTVVHQAPLSMGFSRQEYWSGLPCPPPGDLLNPGIEPMSLISLALAGKFLTLVPRGKYHQLLLNEGHEEVAHGCLS